MAAQATREADTVEAERSPLAALTREGSPVAHLRNGSQQAQALAFSHDGRTLACAYRGSGIALWNTGTHASTWLAASENRDLQAPSFSADDRWLAAVDRRGRVARWNVASGWIEPTTETGREGLRTPAFSSNGARMIAGGPPDGPLAVWDISAGVRVPAAIDFSRIGTLTSVALGPSGRQLAAGSQWGNGLVWDLERDALVRRLYVDGEVDTTALDFGVTGGDAVRAAR